jgi:uncharacterized protein YcfJ
MKKLLLSALIGSWLIISSTVPADAATYKTRRTYQSHRRYVQHKRHVKTAKRVGIGAAGGAAIGALAGGGKGAAIGALAGGGAGAIYDHHEKRKGRN